VRHGRVAAAVLAPLLMGGGIVAAATLGHDAPARPVGSPSASVTPSPTTDPAVAKYAADVRQPLEDGGKVVELGIKPALRDYASGKETLAQLAVESRSWAAALRLDLAQLRTVTVPPRLARAHATYLKALGQYIEIARTLYRASQDRTASRQAVVAEVVRLGKAADATYDEAVRLVAAER
jgi:hypothetical protein